MSKRGIEELIEQTFDVSIALGTIANREQELSAALAPAHEDVRKAVADAAVKHTTKRVGNRRGRSVGCGRWRFRRWSTS